MATNALHAHKLYVNEHTCTGACPSGRGQLPGHVQVRMSTDNRAASNTLSPIQSHQVRAQWDSGAWRGEAAW
jgi:hypothetical protein